jgi:Probable zinc-ribbon domain
MSDYEDLTIICRDCNQPFILTAKDQAFFASMTDDKGNPFKNPVRCKPCRDIKKAQRLGGTFPAPQSPMLDDNFGGEGKKRASGRRRDRDEGW